MQEEISPEIFNHMVELAALELTPEEAAYLRAQLNKQLQAVHALQAIPLDEDTPIASHGVSYTPEISPAPRADEWHPDPNREDIIAQMPAVEDGYIVVPDIPHEELE